MYSTLLVSTVKFETLYIAYITIYLYKILHRSGGVGCRIIICKFPTQESSIDGHCYTFSKVIFNM